MKDKKYLSKLPREVVEKMLEYPSQLWEKIYEVVLENNGMWAADEYTEILGKDANKWVNMDNCSYDWWINIKPGHYKEALYIDYNDYFSEDDQKSLEKLHNLLQQKCDAIDDLGVDDVEDDTYYEKLGALEDEADEIANKMLKIVEKEIKSVEEVTDEQIKCEFFEQDWGDQFYIRGNDYTKVYEDVVKSYKVGK